MRLTLPTRPITTLRDDLRAPTAWPALDGVRGVAVLAAVAWHVLRLYPAAGISSDAVPVGLWPLGTLRFSVDAFFVLSGFLVVRSWQSIRRSRGFVRSVVHFLGRRGARILPAYWLSLLVLVPLVAPILSQQPRRLLAFVTVNQYVKFWLPERVNTVYWTLTTEWHFYLLVPLVSWLLVRAGRTGRWFLLAGFIASSVWWYLNTPYSLPAGFIFGRLDQFAAGAILGQLVVAYARGERSRVVDVVQRPWAGRAITVALLALGSYHGSTFGMGHGGLAAAALRPAVALLIAAWLLRVLTGSPSRVLEHPVARFFGAISFGLYLWHYPILVNGRALQSMTTLLPPLLWSIMIVAGLLVLSMLAATCSYVLVERPFMRLAAMGRTRPATQTGPGTRAETAQGAGTLGGWPSRRFSASRPSTE